MPRTPDEDYDVILYECRNTWTVWLAGAKLGERDSLQAGIALAREIAAGAPQAGLAGGRDGVSLEADRATHPVKSWSRAMVSLTSSGRAGFQNT